MKVIAIAGSARRNGNSDTLLDAAVEVLRESGAEVETIVARSLDIRPCYGCDGCWETGRCVVQDGMQDLYPRFAEVDHVVVAAPIYFTSIPGHLKVLIDRFQCKWVSTFLLKRRPEPQRTGMLIMVGAMDRERYFNCSATVVKSWMATLNMKCPVTRFYAGLDERDAVQSHPEHLDDVRAAARELLDGAGQ